MDNQTESLVIDGNYKFDFINYALSFNNVNDIEFRNCDFLNEDILKLIESKEYNRIAFLGCTFEDPTLINKIQTKSISFTNNKISSYEFIYQMEYLKNLTIVGGNVDAYKINNLKNLEYLRLSDSNIVHIDSLFLNKLKYLFIDNTNISDVSFVKKISSLELLSLSEEQLLKNRDFIKSINNHVKIILDSIIEMEDDSYE